MIIKNVPFFSNTPDDTHCVQAAFRMVLKYFFSKKTFNWEKMDQLTGKKKGLWTWPMIGLMNLKKMGFDVLHFTLFDYEKFAKLGDAYLRELNNDNNVTKAQTEHSDLDYERKNALDYSKSKIHKKILPTLEDVKDFLEKGYLLICNVNSKTLSQKEGYIGHSVVIFGYDEKNLYIHDPGLPPLKNRKVSYQIFSKAWEYTNPKQKNIRAFKLN